VSETFGANETRSVGASLTETIGASETRRISGNQSESIGASHTVTIGGSSTETVGAALSEDIAGGITTSTSGSWDVTAAGGFNVTAAAGINLTLTGGLNVAAPGGVQQVDVEEIKIGGIFSWKGVICLGACGLKDEKFKFHLSIQGVKAGACVSAIPNLGFDAEICTGLSKKKTAGISFKAGGADIGAIGARSKG
jgi:hypothetical protein